MKTGNIFLCLVISQILIACSKPPTEQSSQAGSSSTEASSSKSVEDTGLSNYEELERSALAGDYQAQRNLAYTLRTGIPHNPILGCAWRIVIVESGSDQVDQSDTGNKEFDCDKKLNPEELNAAKAQAKKLQEKIVKKAT